MFPYSLESNLNRFHILDYLSAIIHSITLISDVKWGTSQCAMKVHQLSNVKIFTDKIIIINYK